MEEERVMEKRRIGNLEVSKVGMGCMGFSHGYGKLPEIDYSIEAIRKAYDFGCTFYDTAEIYGAQTKWLGHNEEILGKAVKPFRKNVILATKIHPATEQLKQEKELYRIVREHGASISYRAYRQTWNRVF